MQNKANNLQERYDSWGDRPISEHPLPANRDYKWQFTFILVNHAHGFESKLDYSYKKARVAISNRNDRFFFRGTGRSFLMHPYLRVPSFATGAMLSVYYLLNLSKTIIY